MGKNVNDFKRFVEFVSNKVQQGNTVTPAQFNLVADRAQMQIFVRDYQIFLQTKVMTTFLQAFLKPKTLLIDAVGESPFPSDFEYTANITHYLPKPEGGAITVPVDEVSIGDWGRVASSQLNAPSKRFPKYTEYEGKFRFLPRTLGVAQLDYFKTPTSPVWGYTVSSNEPVYNPTTSVNFDWYDHATNEVAGVYLSMIGVNLKDQEVSEFAEMFKVQNQS